jgi:flagellar L-ring protein precursor FlgH
MKMKLLPPAWPKPILARWKKTLRRGIGPLIFAASLAVPALVSAQSLWRDDVSKPMCADKRATAVGDIITIIISENTTITKNNETKTARSSSLTSAVSSFLFPGFLAQGGKVGGTMPSIAYSSDHKHDGGGAINNSESIIAHVAVQVIDVLPNKNLVIEGKRETSFSGEKQTIILRGIVRAEDVAANNTVLSYNVANATVQIIGKGTVTDSQNKGWFNRIWDKLNPL